MIGIRSAFSIRARGHRPHLEAVYMTAPRFICRNTKKALAERGPSIHDGRANMMPRFVLPLLLALIGLILFGQGVYIHAKALVAQVLLERAFAKTIATGQETKPW